MENRTYNTLLPNQLPDNVLSLRHIYNLFCGLHVYADECQNTETIQLIHNFMSSLIMYLRFLKDKTAVPSISLLMHNATALRELQIEKIYSDTILHIANFSKAQANKLPIIDLQSINNDEIDRNIVLLENFKGYLTSKLQTVRKRKAEFEEKEDRQKQNKHNANTLNNNNSSSDNSNNTSNNKDGDNNSNNTDTDTDTNTESLVNIYSNNIALLYRNPQALVFINRLHQEVESVIIKNADDFKKILPQCILLLKFLTYNNLSNEQDNITNDLQTHFKHLLISLILHLTKIAKGIIRLKAYSSNNLIDINTSINNFHQMITSLSLTVNPRANVENNIQMKLIGLLDYALNEVKKIDTDGSQKFYYMMRCFDLITSLALSSGQALRITDTLAMLLQNAQELTSNKQILAIQHKQYFVLIIHDLNLLTENLLKKLNLQGDKKNYSNTFTLCKKIVDVFRNYIDFLSADFPEVLAYIQKATRLFIYEIVNKLLPYSFAKNNYSEAIKRVKMIVEYSCLTNNHDIIQLVHNYLTNIIKNHYKNSVGTGSMPHKSFFETITVISAYLETIYFYAGNNTNSLNEAIKDMIMCVVKSSQDYVKDNSFHFLNIKSFVDKFIKKLDENTHAEFLKTINDELADLAKISQFQTVVQQRVTVVHLPTVAQEQNNYSDRALDHYSNLFKPPLQPELDSSNSSEKTTQNDFESSSNKSNNNYNNENNG